LEKLFERLREIGVIDVTLTWGLVKVENFEELDKSGYTELAFDQFQRDWCCTCALCQEARSWYYDADIVKKKIKKLLKALGYDYVEAVFIPEKEGPAIIAFGKNYVALLAPRRYGW